MCNLPVVRGPIDEPIQCPEEHQSPSRPAIAPTIGSARRLCTHARGPPVSHGIRCAPRSEEVRRFVLIHKTIMLSSFYCLLTRMLSQCYVRVLISPDRENPFTAQVWSAVVVQTSPMRHTCCCPDLHAGAQIGRFSSTHVRRLRAAVTVPHVGFWIHSVIVIRVLLCFRFRQGVNQSRLFVDIRY
jgi:hypothetical protein